MQQLRKHAAWHMLQGSYDGNEEFVCGMCGRVGSEEDGSACGVTARRRQADIRWAINYGD